jgi:hypothetical protein
MQVAITARADDDLPGRVARVANVQGVLRHAPDERAGEWAEIGLNYPVAQGDNLLLDRDGVAEIDYGGGQFRLAGGTNLHVSRLDDRQLALFIAAGRVIVRVRVLDPDDSVRIDTPATQVALQRPGLYRVDVASDSPLTSVIVREGEAEVGTPTGVEVLLPGQTASLTGIGGEHADIRNGGGIDDFDTWSAARDRVYEAPRQDAYVSRQMIGQADLDAYGAWQSLPDYGAVWFPTVDPEWAPYRFGYWTWLSGWGYTWVDQAPWGYAPFHYGRWAYIAGRWGWCPGAFVARPLWAPALVAWYGDGRWSHGMGPVYGWVPLGWREPFVPWWNRCTDRCLARYNRPYAVNVAEHRGASPTHYANWRVPGGLTAVTGAALMSGGPVAPNRVPVRADAGSAPPPLARPPAFKPVTPVRPAMRVQSPLPLPASALEASPRPAVVAPTVRADSRAPLRIDDGRFVLPPTPRAVPPASVAAPMNPTAPERAYRTSPLPSRTGPVTVPPAAALPRPAAPVSVAPAPVPPASVPHAIPPAAASPRVLPTPVPPASMPAQSQVAVPVPVPVPQAVAPAPSQRGVPARAAPPNPGPNDRPN